MVNRKRRPSLTGRFPTFSERIKWENSVSSGKHLDSSLNDLEECRFKRKHYKVITRLFKELHFTYEEIETLVVVYYKLLKVDNQESTRKEITKLEVKDVLHNVFDITDTKMVEQIIPAIDNVPGPMFSMEKWLRCMSLFLRGNLEEHIQFCFQVYDFLRQGSLNPKMLIYLMSGSGTEDADFVKDIVEMIVKKMDIEKTGVVSFQDFRRTILEQPLLLECFGQCLPTRLAIHSVLTTFTGYIGKL